MLLDFRPTSLHTVRRSGGFQLYSLTVYCALIFTDAREVFDLFDFWDGRDGEVDAFKLGDLLRCLGHNPTNAIVAKHGGTEKMGKWKGYLFDICSNCTFQGCFFIFLI